VDLVTLPFTEFIQTTTEADCLGGGLDEFSENISLNNMKDN